jgi:hypothetical protein
MDLWDICVDGNQLQIMKTSPCCTFSIETEIKTLLWLRNFSLQHHIKSETNSWQSTSFEIEILAKQLRKDRF